MGEIGIFNEDKSKWIQFDSDTEVHIRHIGRQELKKLQRKASKAANISDVDEIDYFNGRLGRAAVLGWRKIKDHKHPGFMRDGVPISFSEDNLDTFMNDWLDFSNFVNTHAIDTKIFLEEKEKKASEKKGLGPISGPDQIIPE